MDHGPVASRGNMPREHLQRPRMDERAAAGREKLGERGRILRGRVSKPALVTREARLQIQHLVVLPLLLNGLVLV